MEATCAALADMSLHADAPTFAISRLPAELQLMIFDEYFKLHNGCFVARVGRQIATSLDAIAANHDGTATSQFRPLGPTALLLVSKSVLSMARPRAVANCHLYFYTTSAFLWIISTHNRDGSDRKVRSIILDNRAWDDSGASAREAPEHVFLTRTFRSSAIEHVEVRGRPTHLAMAYRPFDGYWMSNPSLSEGFEAAVRNTDVAAFHRMLRHGYPKSLATFRYRVLAVDNCMTAFYHSFTCNECLDDIHDFCQLESGDGDAVKARNLQLEQPQLECRHRGARRRRSWRRFVTLSESTQVELLGWPGAQRRDLLLRSIVYREWKAVEKVDGHFARMLAEHKSMLAEQESMLVEQESAVKKNTSAAPKV